MKAYSSLNPYLEYQSSVLSHLAQNQIFFTYIAALFISNELLAEEATMAVCILLIMSLLGIVCFACYMEMRNYIEFANRLKIQIVEEQTKTDQYAMYQKSIMQVNRIKSTRSIVQLESPPDVQLEVVMNPIIR